MATSEPDRSGETLQLGELREHLDAALLTLPEKTRSAVALHHLEGLPQAEVAARLGCSEEAAKKRIQYGMARLRDRLARHRRDLTPALLLALLHREAAAAPPPDLLAACSRAGLSAAGDRVTTLAGAARGALLLHGVLQTAVWVCGGLALIGVGVYLGLQLALSAGPAPADPRNRGSLFPPPDTPPARPAPAETTGSGVDPEAHRRAGLLGPFVWTRALDLGEDARLEREAGLYHLWLYGYARGDDPRGQADAEGTVGDTLLPRNNLVAVDRRMRFAVRIDRVRIGTEGAHNIKILLGYVTDRFTFAHGDDTDLMHRAASERLCLLVPIRHPFKADTDDPATYVIPHTRPAQPPCVIRLGAGEDLAYDWTPDAEDARVVADLAGTFRDLAGLRPGVTQPIIAFDLDPDRGTWRLRVETDGRDWLAGGARDGDFDHSVTGDLPAGAPPAVRYWTLSVISPGGKPFDSAELECSLLPLDPDGSVPRHRGDLPPVRRVRSAPIPELAELFGD